jgi:hypothetical protein
MNDSPLNSEKPLLEQDGQSENLASESLENQGPQEPKIEISGKDRTLTFKQVNACTWKLTDGRGSLAWSGDRSGSYRTTRAVAWLIGVGGGQWVARYRNKASKPMKLPKAKTYALEMVKGIRPGKVTADPIGRLLRLHLDVLEPMPKMARIWAIETPDYRALYSRPSGPSESPKGDDYPLEYYTDGYPKIPACLDRRKRLAEAAE